MIELYVTKPNELELRHVAPLRAPRDDEVKIQLIYGGICGSDLSVFKGKLPHATYPVRPGHELLGVIVEKGENVAYDIGTRVVVLPNTYCGTCDLCVKGYTNICRNKKSLGVNVDGGFSQQFLISSKYVLPVPDGLPNERAVLIEPFAVVVHAFKKVKITKDTTVAVIGCGNEGMLAIALAHHLGAKVTAIDINTKKFDLVKKIGDIRTRSPLELQHEKFDIVFEAAGTKSAVEQAIRITNPGGDVVLIGLATEAIFPVVHIVRSELTIHGTIIYQFPDDYLQAIEYLRDPSFSIDPVVSKILPVADYQQAYKLAASGNVGKVILSFKEV
ncbi:alcohol dehydrogenase catalytic domain-containing protein [Parageobacillus sp. KH3-4]|uniref:zinc-dependent alcohol dehydrogenase n=1 Tax=Parageobacillus sp. KH3-4 TaxID=2916802 RepID=UPI001FCC2AF2|nr:alcohol dehydrogenase catalytic domain-containing protein [Parageobacillus sp. KH3-4]BDG46834.1 dehydrogenase [Parageobacillus sp. KH3-4]